MQSSETKFTKQKVACNHFDDKGIRDNSDPNPHPSPELHAKHTGDLSGPSSQLEMTKENLV